LIGGLGTLEGPILGALIFFVLNKFLSDYGTWYLIGLGALAILVTMFFPQGLWGFVSRRFGLQLFPVGRRVVFLDDETSARPATDDVTKALNTSSAAHRA